MWPSEVVIPQSGHDRKGDFYSDCLEIYPVLMVAPENHLLVYLFLFSEEVLEASAPFGPFFPKSEVFGGRSPLALWEPLRLAGLSRPSDSVNSSFPRMVSALRTSSYHLCVCC